MSYRLQHGFTLIELMITLVIAAIMLTLALPSFQQAMRSNRVATTSNELLASLALARGEALKGIGPAGVCATTDGTACTDSTDWSAGWVVWRQEGGEQVVVRYVQTVGRITVAGPEAGVDFTVQGRSSEGSEQFGIAPSDSDAPARCVSVNVTGQTRLDREACA